MEERPEVPSADEFRTLAENSPDIIDRFDREFRHLYINSAGLRLLGLPAGQVTGKTIRETGVPEPFCSLWEERIREVFASARPMETTDSFPSSDGLRLFESRCVPESAPDGSVQSVLVISRDITVRQWTEDTQRELEQRYRRLVDVSPDAIFINRGGLIAFINEAGLRLFGAERPEQVLGKSPMDFTHPDYHAAVRERIRHQLEHKLPVPPLEEKICRLDGSLVDVEVAAAPILDGGEWAAQVVMRDITERKRTEEALANERNLYMDLVNSLPAGVYRLRIKAQKTWAETEWVEKVATNYHLDMVSDQFCLILGVSREQLEANAATVVECLHPEDRADFTRRNVIALETMETFRWEGRVLNQGQTRWVHFASVPRRLSHGDVIWTGVLIDITDRKQAEDALRESERQLQLALSASHAGAWAWEAATDAMRCNDRFRQQYGFDPHETPSLETWLARLHSGDRQRVLSKMLAMLEPGGPDVWHEEFRTVHPVRGECWMLEVGQVERGPDGRGTRFAGINLDITRHKLAEEDRRESEERFTRAFRLNAALMTLCMIDDGCLLDVNDAFENVLGYSREEAVGQSVMELGIWVDPGQRADFIRTLRERGTSPHRIVQFRAKTGEIHEMLWGGTPVTIRGETLLLTTAIDITDRVRAQEALSKSEENLQAMFDGSREAIMLLDAKGVVLNANAAMCERLNIAAKDFVGTQAFDVLPPDQAKTSQAWFHEILATRRPKSFEDERNGRFMESHLYPIMGPSGEVARIAVFVHDITDRKRAERVLQESHDELEKNVRERTSKLRALAAQLTQAEHRERRRIADVLHEDLQQRLVAMQFKISGLKMLAGKESAARDTEWLLQELDRTIQLSRDLTIRLRPPVLYELGLRPALEWLAEKTRSSFGLIVNIKGGKSFHLATDELRVFAFEAVSELLMNVVKHAGTKVAKIKIGWQGKDKLAIEVSDKGRGFDSARHTQETTFGLFSIRERTEAFGGRLEIASRPGKGTRATLILPASPGPIERARESPRTAAGRKGRKTAPRRASAAKR